MSDYSDIIKRLETAIGPDKVLSRDIFFTLDNDEWKAAYLKAQEPCGCPHHLAVIGAADFLPDVTASIDEAMVLVNGLVPGEWFDFGGTAGEDGWECNIHTDYIEVQEHARTAPIAILLSLFKVLRAKEERG
jgi:hypothetical protein